MEPTNRTHLIRTDLLVAVLLGSTLPSFILAEASTMRLEQLRGDITVVRVEERPHTVMAALPSPEGALLVDFENPLFHGFEHPAPGDDMAGLARTYEELLARLPDDALLITGHGPVVDREELVRAHGMLVDTLAWVQKRLAAGDERQAIQASAPPAPWDDRWQGSRRAMGMWIGAIFRSFELERGAAAELLRIHQQALDAHRRSDADTLIALHADEVLSADLRGGIVRSTRAEQAEMFRSYLGSTTYSVYEDRTPPVARVSQDGSLGWVIADVRAEGTRKGAAGSSDRLAMRSVWIELYARRDGSWRLVGTVSDVEPLGPD